jgi:hypothetical protein
MTSRVRSLQRFLVVALAWLCTAIAGFPASVSCEPVSASDAQQSATLRSSAPGGVARRPRIAETVNGGSWSLDGERLEFADKFGQSAVQIDLGERGYGIGLDFAVDPYDHSAWLGTDLRLLLHFSTDGTLLGGASLTGNVDALVIALDQTPWIVSQGAVLHLSGSARVLESYATPAKPDEALTGFAVDSLRDQLWFGTSSGLWRIPFHHSGAAGTDTVGVQEPRAIALDPRSGDLWILTKDDLVVVDHAGTPQSSVEVPADARADPARLDFDSTRERAVVRAETRVFVVGRDGQVEGERQSAVAAAADIAAAPFAIVPTAALIRPPAGAATGDPLPELTMQLGAQCNAFRCAPAPYVDSIALNAQLDGNAASHRVVDASSGRVVIAPIVPLPAGAHRVTARVIDRFGREAQLSATITVLEHGAATRDAMDDEAVTAASPAPGSRHGLKAANKLPSVVLTTPASGATYVAGASIALVATASDPDGSVAKIEFYRNGSTLLGTVSSFPYQLTWPNVAAGTYSLTAKAYDNRNGTATSVPVAISVLANKPPVVTLTQPAAGAFYGEGSAIVVTAAASDADGSVARVEFLNDTTVIGIATASPFVIAWTGAPAGNHAIAARAIDDKGSATVSLPVTITVGQPPLVVVKTPVACSVVDAGAALSLAADAISTHGSISSVEFFDNGTSVGTTFAEPWTALLPHPGTGTHTISARATDDRGLEAQSRPVIVTVGGANQPPIVAMASPADGSRFASGATVNLSANASDPDGLVGVVEYRLNDGGGTLIGRATSTPFSAAWASPSAGAYAIVAVASDDRGAKTTSTPVHVTIDANAPPTVRIVAPEPNRMYQAPATIAMTASATDSDGSIANVDFFAGVTLVGSASAAPYTATWSTVATGSYMLTARATDNNGATTTSVPVPIVVTSNAAPSITLRPLGDEQYFAPATLVLGADAADSDGTIARVEFRLNGALVGLATTAPYSYVLSGVATGSYSITATAIDDHGAATTTTPVNVNVGGTLAVTMSPGLDGSTVGDDNVLVRGVVSAPSNSAITINGVVTHVDDFGQFQANDIPLEPGANTVTAVVATQDGQTASQTILVNSTGRGTLVAHAAPTEGLNSLAVRFTVENPDDVSLSRITFDFDNDGATNLTATPSQFVDGKLTVSATYPIGTWTAVITAYDDRDQAIYSARKAIVVLSPAALRAKLKGVYDGMLGRLRAGNVAGALTAFTGTARDRYGPVLSQLESTLPTIIADIGELREISVGIDLAELSVVRTTTTGAEQFMLYMLRSEDGIWRFDGM